MVSKEIRSPVQSVEFDSHINNIVYRANQCAYLMPSYLDFVDDLGPYARILKSFSYAPPDGNVTHSVQCIIADKVMFTVVQHYVMTNICMCIYVLSYNK